MELRTTKYEHSEVGLIPKDWNVKSLGNVGEVKMCKRIFNHQTQKNGDIPFYKIGTFGKEPDAFISKELYDEFKRKYSFPTKGSVLISAAGTIGRLVVYDGKDAYYQDSNIIWIENNNQVISNEYLKHCFPTVRFQTEGGTIQRLYNNIVKNGLFPCPPTEKEQRAIAQVLSDTDALIRALEKKIAKKKLIKKGVMQRLLKTESSWEELTFENLCKTFTKQTGFDYTNYIKPSLLIGYQRGTLPFIQNKDFEGFWFNFDTDFYIPEKVADKFPMILLDEKCLLISISGKIGNVGVFSNERKSFLGGAIAIAKFKNQKLLTWVMIYLQSENGQTKLFNNVKAGSHQNLILDDIRKMIIPIPSEDEQNQIAQILSDIDKEIENLEQKLSKYQLAKQGMMQQLLTGKIRLV